jgi:hypothetical protein
MWHTEPGKFYGLRAEMSIWGSPNQENSQESGSAIQIYCQEGEHYSLIEAGFHVHTYHPFSQTQMLFKKCYLNYGLACRFPPLCIITEMFDSLHTQR